MFMMSGESLALRKRDGYSDVMKQSDRREIVISAVLLAIVLAAVILVGVSLLAG